MKKYNPAPIRATRKIAVMLDILPNLSGESFAINISKSS